MYKNRFTGLAHKNKRREIVCQFRALCNDLIADFLINNLSFFDLSKVQFNRGRTTED